MILMTALSLSEMVLLFSSQLGNITEICFFPFQGFNLKCLGRGREL